MGPSWARSKVIQSDMPMGNWNVKLLLNSMVKGHTALSGILWYCAGQLRVSPRRLCTVCRLQTQRVNQPHQLECTNLAPNDFLEPTGDSAHLVHCKRRPRG